jgi:hypothetical protein
LKAGAASWGFSFLSSQAGSEAVEIVLIHFTLLPFHYDNVSLAHEPEFITRANGLSTRSFNRGGPLQGCVPCAIIPIM